MPLWRLFPWRSRRRQHGSSGGGNYELYGFDPTLTESGANSAERFTFNNAFDGYPATRPHSAAYGDGLAWVSDRMGSMDIYFTDYEMLQSANLTYLPDLDPGSPQPIDMYPSFSKDGKWIAFSSDKFDGNFDIYRMLHWGENLKRITFEEMDDFDPCYGGG